jgi:hypothetical protein
VRYLGFPRNFARARVGFTPLSKEQGPLGPSNRTGLAMIFKLARLPNETGDVSMANQLPKMSLDVRFADGMEVVTSEAQAVAA